MSHKTINFFLTFLIIVLTIVKTSYAQSFHFRNYSVEDGLPFVQVATIFQDTKGNLWSGGYGGLSKFDGISFKNYTPNDGLANHSVTCITDDNQNNLWIGTINGISKFDGKKFSTFTSEHGLIGNHVTCCLKDNKGNIWLGTTEGLSKLTDGSFINFSTKNELIGNEIQCLYQDKSKNIWVGTSTGISVFDGKKFKNYSVAKGVSVNCIRQDVQGSIWVATSNGLCKISENTILCYTQKDGLIDNRITSLLIDSKGILWMATPTGLIKKIETTFENININADKNSNKGICLFEDYEKNIWIGTFAGLYMYRGNPFIRYGIKEGLTSEFVFAILRDSEGTLWVGTEVDGLFQFNDKKNKFTHIGKKQGVTSNFIGALFEVNPRELWISGDKGLTIYSNKKFIQHSNDTSGVFKNPVQAIYKDSKNTIWLGGEDCVYKYVNGVFIRYPVKGRSKTFQIWSIVEDKQGNIWFGAYLGGLIKYDGKQFTEVSESLNLKNDSYLTSIIDEEGNIYFATLDGVWMLNPETKKTIRFGEEDGLSSDLVYSLLFGKTKNEIWAGTNQGVNDINIGQYKKTGIKNIVSYGKEEGFTGVECNTNGGFVEKDSSIWFGTVNGMIKYNPSEYFINKTESKISITGFKLFYTDTLLNNNIHLHYNENNITIKFIGISLSNPLKVKYSHILEGFEDSWSPPSKERTISYSNLAPGTYTFKVISTNNEGKWNTLPATFSFTIDRPYWKTWWFLILLSSFTIIILIVSIRYRIIKIKNKEKYKTELNKKIAHIESQALRAQMNPHFIFNTMSSIQHYISNNDSESALKYLSKFAKLMRIIMDNSKQQMIPVAEEINALELYLQLEVMRFDKKFKFQIKIDSSIDKTYDRIPSMLIQPYVENSIIHGLLPKDGIGEIKIYLTKQNDTILCTIEDNGIGRENSLEFKKNRVQQHKSMGMSITKERLQILNSSLNSNLSAEIIDMYENGKPAGTKVMLIIPTENEEN